MLLESSIHIGLLVLRQKEDMLPSCLLSSRQSQNLEKSSFLYACCVGLLAIILSFKTITQLLVLFLSNPVTNLHFIAALFSRRF